MADGRVVIDIIGDSQPYSKTLDSLVKETQLGAKSIGEGFQKASQSISTVGEIITKGITLPLMNVGTLFLKTALCFQLLKENIYSTFKALLTSAQTATKALDDLCNTLKAIQDVWRNASNETWNIEVNIEVSKPEAAEKVFNSVRSELNSMKDGIVQVGRFFLEFAPTTKPLSDALAGSKLIFEEFQKKGLLGAKNALFALIPSLSAVSGVIKSFGSLVSTSFKSVFSEMSLFETVGTKLSSAFEPIKNKVTSALAGIATGISLHIGVLKEKMSAAFGTISEAVAPKIKNFTTKTGELLSPLREILGSVSSKVSAAAPGIIGGFGKIGSGFMKASGGIMLGAGALGVGLIGAVVAADKAGIDIGAKLTEIIGEVQGFANKMPALVSDLVSQLPAMLGQITTALPQVAASLGEALGTVLSSLPSLMPALSETISTLITSLASLIGTIAPQLAIAAPALLQGLIDGILGGVPAIIAQIPTVIQALVGAIVAIAPMLIEAGLNLIMQLVQGVISAIPALTAAIPQIINVIIDVLTTGLPMILNAAVMLFEGIINALPQIIPALLEGITTLISRIAGFLPSLIGQILTAAIQLFMAFTKALPQILPALIEAVINIITSIVTMIPELIPLLLVAAVQLFMALVDAVPEIVDALVGAVGQLIMGVINIIPEFIGSLIESGKKLWTGLVDAVTGKKSEVDSAANDSGTSMVSSFESGASGLEAAGESAFGHLASSTEAGMQSVTASVESGTTAMAGAAESGTKEVTSKFELMQTNVEKLSGGTKKAAEDNLASLSVPGVQSLTKDLQGLSEQDTAALETKFANLGIAIKKFLESASTAVSVPALQNLDLSGVAKMISTSEKLGKVDMGAIGQKFGKFADSVVAAIPKLSQFGQLSGPFDAGVTSIEAGGNRIKASLSSMGNSGMAGFGKLKVSVTTGIAGVVSAVSAGASQITGSGNRIKVAFNGVGSAGTSSFGLLRTAVASGIQACIAQMRAGSTQMGISAKSMMMQVGNQSKSARAGFVAAGQYVASGLAQGIRNGQAGVLAAGSAIARALEARVRAELKIKSPSLVFKEIGGYIVAGLTLAIDQNASKPVQAMQEMIYLINQQAEKTGGAITGVIAKMDREADKLVKAYEKKLKGKNKELNKAQKKKLEAFSKKVEKQTKKNTDVLTRVVTSLETQVKDATEALEGARKAFDDYAGSIKDKFSSFAQITSLDLGNADPSEYIASLKERFDASREFAANINKLRAMGLNQGALDDIISAGIEKGGLIAESLAGATAAEISEINSLQSQITAQGETLGQSMAEQFYQSGIDAAQGLIDGLKKKMKDVTAIAKSMGKTISKELKKQLKIKSPSRVLYEVGSFAGEGVALGFADWISTVRSLSADMAGAVTGGFGRGSGSTSVAYNTTINTPVTSYSDVLAANRASARAAVARA